MKRSSQRMLHFSMIFKDNNTTMESVAKKIGLSKRSLISKINNNRRFYENEIKEILEILEKPFEEVFKY